MPWRPTINSSSSITQFHLIKDCKQLLRTRSTIINMKTRICRLLRPGRSRMGRTRRPWRLPTSRLRIGICSRCAKTCRQRCLSIKISSRACLKARGNSHSPLMEAAASHPLALETLTTQSASWHRRTRCWRLIWSGRQRRETSWMQDYSSCSRS